MALFFTDSRHYKAPLIFTIFPKIPTWTENLFHYSMYAMTCPLHRHIHTANVLITSFHPLSSLEKGWGTGAKGTGETDNGTHLESKWHPAPVKTERETEGKRITGRQREKERENRERWGWDWRGTVGYWEAAAPRSIWVRFIKQWVRCEGTSL